MHIKLYLAICLTVFILNKTGLPLVAQETQSLYLVHRNTDLSVDIFDITTNVLLVTVLSPYNAVDNGDRVQDVEFSSDGRYVVIGYTIVRGNSFLRLYDFQTLTTTDKDLEGNVFDIDWRPHHNQFALTQADPVGSSGISDPIVLMLDTSMVEIHRYEITSGIYSLQWDFQGDRLAISDYSNIHIYDFETWTKLKSLSQLQANEKIVQQIAWSSDNNLIAAADDSSLNIWNYNTGQILTSILKSSGYTRNLLWNYENTALSTRTLSNFETWNVFTGQKVFGSSERIFDFVWLPNYQLKQLIGDTIVTLDASVYFNSDATPSPTPIPSSTPTPLPTVTPPPPTATVTPAALVRLRLTSMCSSDPSTVRVWRVRNPNAAQTLVTWDVVGTAQTGSLIVPAAVNGVSGEALFQTVAVAGSNTTRLFLNSVQQDVRASGGAVCP